MGILQQGIRWSLVAGAIVGIGLVAGCSDDSGSGISGSSASTKPSTGGSASEKMPLSPPKAVEPEVPVVDTRTHEELVEAGRSVYLGNCIACHNLDPKQDGALGPAVSGASLELLEARLLRGGYPEGYTPKRTSRVMVPLPHLKPVLPELAVFLESLK